MKSNGERTTSIQLLEDIHQINNLMGRNSFMFTAGRHEETVALFAAKTPGVRIEIASLGVWEGTAGIRRYCVGVNKYIEGDRIGHLCIHTITSPVIEVAGDGKTAKGVWISPGIETRPSAGKIKALWAWVKYGVDFVREDNAWKFWHYHVYNIFMTDYHKSWVEANLTPSLPDLPEELKPDRPSTHNWVYSPTVIPEYGPLPPQPYDTFDDKTAY